MTKEKSISNLKFIRFRRYASREATKKLRQIELLLMNRQVPHDITPLLISTILRPEAVMSAIAECKERQQGGCTQ